MRLARVFIVGLSYEARVRARESDARRDRENSGENAREETAGARRAALGYFLSGETSGRRRLLLNPQRLSRGASICRAYTRNITLYTYTTRLRPDEETFPRHRDKRRATPRRRRRVVDQRAALTTTSAQFLCSAFAAVARYKCQPRKNRLRSPEVQKAIT